MVTVKAASVPKTRDGHDRRGLSAPKQASLQRLSRRHIGRPSSLVTTRQVVWRTRSDQLLASIDAAVGAPSPGRRRRDAPEIIRIANAAGTTGGAVDLPDAADQTAGTGAGVNAVPTGDGAADDGRIVSTCALHQAFSARRQIMDHLRCM